MTASTRRERLEQAYVEGWVRRGRGRGNMSDRS